MSPHGNPMGTHGNPWGPMGPHGDPWDPMWTNGTPWGPMGPHGNPWGPMGTHRGPWGPMGPHGDPWLPMGTHGDPWESMGTPDRAHARTNERTKRNDFPVGLPPPNLRFPYRHINGGPIGEIPGPWGIRTQKNISSKLLCFERSPSMRGGGSWDSRGNMGIRLSGYSRVGREGRKGRGRERG